MQQIEQKIQPNLQDPAYAQRTQNTGRSLPFDGAREGGNVIQYQSIYLNATRGQDNCNALSFAPELLQAKQLRESNVINGGYTSRRTKETFDRKYAPVPTQRKKKPRSRLMWTDGMHMRFVISTFQGENCRIGIQNQFR
jgi:hypothetical protein